jgi:oligopeptide/dipeptide ABC transporter ATP-binding protein
VLLISHDIGVISYSCERVLVMYAGKVVESLPTHDMESSARHPYTRALLGAVPTLDADRDQALAVIPGRPPDPSDLPSGCAFADRCERATEGCRSEDPVLLTIGRRHDVACWHPMDPSTPVRPEGVVVADLVAATGDPHE